MPNLEAQAAWVPVREIGIELARGGPNGNMNEQATALLARTEWLDQQKASKSEIVQGHYEFNTYAEFNAIKSTLPLNCTVIINEMPMGTQTWGQGTNRWNGTILSKSPYDPLAQAKADATTKANAAEANAKSYTNEKTSSLLSQSSIDDSDIEIMISNRRGLQTWLQVNKDGKPTDFVYQLIQAYLSNNLLHNTSGPSGFIVSDRRGTALIDSDQSAVSVSNKYDLTTVKFHGSSTMRFMQNELFAKLKNEFKQIQAALYTNRNSGGTLNDLATEIGINDGLLKFTDNKIYATAPSPVVGVGLKYGLPTTYDIPISLTNGFKGTLKNTGFVASNATSDFELPVDLEINFKSDMTDYTNCVSIVNLGKNNMSGSNSIVVNAVVSMTRDAVSFLDKQNGEHTVVIGHTTNRGSSADFVKNVKDVNAQLKALYFKRYFGLFDYIFSDQVWTDTGLTKTAEDIAAIAAETLPPSLTDDGIHLNTIANSAVSTKIVQFIKTLGWY